jgi:hypothetical protein
MRTQTEKPQSFDIFCRSEKMALRRMMEDLKFRRRSFSHTRARMRRAYISLGFEAAKPIKID